MRCDAVPGMGAASAMENPFEAPPSDAPTSGAFDGEAEKHNPFLATPAGDASELHRELYPGVQPDKLQDDLVAVLGESEEARRRHSLLYTSVHITLDGSWAPSPHECRPCLIWAGAAAVRRRR